MCTWCGAAGHIEKTCYSKANGSARGDKSSRGRGRGRSGRGRGGGYSKFGEREGEEEEEEQEYSKVMIGEVNMVTDNGDGEEREWVCDSGADFHITNDVTLFDFLETIPSTFFVKEIKGKVAITQWGVVRLCTDGANGEKRELELRQVLFMPSMKVNIFLLQRIRCVRHCVFSTQITQHKKGLNSLAHTQTLSETHLTKSSFTK